MIIISTELKSYFQIVIIRTHFARFCEKLQFSESLYLSLRIVFHGTQLAVTPLIVRNIPPLLYWSSRHHTVSLFKKKNPLNSFIFLKTNSLFFWEGGMMPGVVILLTISKIFYHYAYHSYSILIHHSYKMW